MLHVELEKVRNSHSKLSVIIRTEDQSHKLELFLIFNEKAAAGSSRSAFFFAPFMTASYSNLYTHNKYENTNDTNRLLKFSPQYEDRHNDRGQEEHVWFLRSQEPCVEFCVNFELRKDGLSETSFYMLFFVCYADFLRHPLTICKNEMKFRGTIFFRVVSPGSVYLISLARSRSHVTSTNAPQRNRSTRKTNRDA